ncbi:alpha/beta hydrolase [Caulobacter sp. CCNWLY153]|uniref:Alpha/beta hydrolase n=2 Tax=Caulobacter TaxID=75 RepID=A0A2T9JIN7_9CAUL|nr:MULTISPECIES: alpha/beta hydrolase [Caulobacter]NGM49358.1 alpha/beta hydrolase [Caulobacter sp. 602-2]PVM79425.1 alpha/beta hydrolase [Caulobacter radicis]PVM83516.1 alpha/beta hydrolase [Caulobacter radicis]
MNVQRRNNVTIEGEGSRTLMFAHGYGCDQSMWRLVAPHFLADKVVLFDHVGAGDSDVSAYQRQKYAGLAGYAEDVIEICEAQGLREVVFVGHSVSAMIGALAAIRRPDLFSRLIMICASPRFANDEGYGGGFDQADLEDLIELLAKNQLDWSSALAPAVVGDAGFQAEWRDKVCRIDPVIAEDFARATFLSDHRSDCRSVSTPTLLIECSDDALAPATVGAFVHEAIAGSQRVVLQATGHSPHLTAPDAVLDAMRAFLAGAPAATA